MEPSHSGQISTTINQYAHFRDSTNNCEGFDYHVLLPASNDEASIDTESMPSLTYDDDDTSLDDELESIQDCSETEPTIPDPSIEASLTTISTPTHYTCYGHDGFQLLQQQLFPVIKEWVANHPQDPYTTFWNSCVAQGLTLTTNFSTTLSILQVSGLENYYHFLLNSPPLKSHFHFEWDNKIIYSNLTFSNVNTPKLDNRGSLFSPINNVDDTSTLTDHSKTLLLHPTPCISPTVTNPLTFMQDKVLHVPDIQQQILVLQQQLNDYNNQFEMTTKKFAKQPAEYDEHLSASKNTLTHRLQNAKASLIQTTEQQRHQLATMPLP